MDNLNSMMDEYRGLIIKGQKLYNEALVHPFNNKKLKRALKIWSKAQRLNEMIKSTRCMLQVRI